MSDWAKGTLADAIASLDAGISVNAEDRPHGAGEIGVLKTSAVSGGVFLSEQNKAVLLHERRLVAEPVQADSILVSRMNTPALVGESCYVSEAHPTLFLPDRLWQLKPRDQTQLSMRWLSFILQSADYRRYVEVHATGTSGSMKNLPKSKLLAFPVHYPAPAEQSIIAKILDTLDTAIRETEALIGKLEAVKQGLLHDLLTRGIDVNGQLHPPQNEAPQLYKESPLGWVPRKWSCRTLAHIANTYAGGTPSRDTPGFFGGDISWVKSTEVNRESISSTDEQITQLGLRNSSAKWVPADTPLIAMYGATAGVVSWLAIPATTNQAVLAAVPNTDQDGRWIYWALIWSAPRLLASVQGSGQPNLSKSTIDSLVLAVPERSEQTAIAKILDQHVSRLAKETNYLAKVRAQKFGLMDDLLTGRVRATPLLESMQRISAKKEG
ncbi:restriction endonuclease subunit S [Pseudomonas sp. KCJK9111]|uniref:restriction endonuclease subunit S n=1 Tax=Pseudomonas sp. KCJK9111 TaxID=3344555 RepID=UPI0039068D5E